ncbi:MAG: glycosyltransferase family 39 protein [Bacteroidales bacterium]|jgi:4-amino-4-deoxy-L-arabinose transferase-like glycosyltransferase|nr:glycosyltransferase family 39 protein [Bacteroidales bacterium]
MKLSALSKKPYFFLALALVLFFPAYLINIGDQPIIEDEAIRSLVAFEMYKSGDYITPTIGGEEYLRKPPLYNWFIAASYAVFGNYSELAIRFPMILSLLFFSLTIFLVVKRELGTWMGVLNALIYLTLGRIIIYESLHGLIDLAFSWVTYLVFMLSWFYFRRGQYLKLFMAAYFLTAVTWMMKGLPSLVFLGITLLVLFISQKRFKILFNWRHFAGILLFIGLVGGYYLLYFNQNDVSPEELFRTLLGQTTRRTVVRFGWLQTIQHIFIFPFEMMYHFLPWTLLLAVLIMKGSRKHIWSHPFLRYNILLLVFNIIPYWTSPEVHPRYILMLIPLLLLPLSWYLVKIRPAILPKLCWLAVIILMLRIVFDFTVLPTRQKNSQEVLSKQSAIELAEKSKGKELYSYWNEEFEPSFYYMKNFLAFRYHFHLAAARDEILYNISDKKPEAWYFSANAHIAGDSIIRIGTVDQHLDDTSPLPLFVFYTAN